MEVAEIVTDEYLSAVRDNFLRVAENVENTRARLGLGYEIEICAASKTVSADIINSLVPYGLKRIGENRLNELNDKYDSYSPLLTKDFIGTLQSNKIRQLVSRVSLIQSLGTDSAAAELERVCALRGVNADVLIEINSGREENKSGVFPEAAQDFAAGLAQYPHIRLRGFMTVGAVSASDEEYRKFFDETYRILIDNRNNLVHNIDGENGAFCPVLSMGMSDNYITAIECGATMIRPGRAIFGSRVYKTAL